MPKWSKGVIITSVVSALLAFVGFTVIASETAVIIPGGKENQLTPKWIFHAEEPYIAKPLIQNGLIFVGSNLNKFPIGAGRLYGIDISNGAKKFEVEESGPISFEPIAISRDILLVGLRGAENDVQFVTYSLNGSKIIGNISETFSGGGLLIKDGEKIVVHDAPHAASFQILQLITKKPIEKIDLKSKLIFWGGSDESIVILAPESLIKLTIGNRKVTKLNIGTNSAAKNFNSFSVRDSLVFLGIEPARIQIWDLDSKKLLKDIQMSKLTGEAWIDAKNIHFEIEDKIIYVATDNSWFNERMTKRIYSDTGMVYAVNWETGQLFWKAQIGGDATEVPIIGKKFLFVRENDSKVYVIDKVSGKVKWIFLISDSPNIGESNFAVNNDMLFISRGSDIFAYDLESY